MNRQAPARDARPIANNGLMPITPALLLLAVAACAPSQPPHAAQRGEQPAEDWRARERALLGPTQLTFDDRFARAGEAYFAPDWNGIENDRGLVIFQAIERPREGAEADPFYGMFVGRIGATGLDDITRVSPPSSANTCGWFHPSSPRILFGSTNTRPSDEQRSGFQVGSRRYVWMFPEEMEIVERNLAPVFGGAGGGSTKLGRVPTSAELIKPVFSLPNYDAECSYDPSGRFLLYAHVEDGEAGGKPDANIYIFDTRTEQHHALVTAPGYDGGPFFSPDGKSICYRSDRNGDDLLQIFVADLLFEEGVPVGISREWQLTDNGHVNWAPYWHPSGEFLVYASSEAGHTNYELFAIESPMERLRNLAQGAPAAPLCRHVRVTFAPGADILPAFNADGSKLMWTSQRHGPAREGERPSSQLWIAEWKGISFNGAVPATGGNEAKPGSQRGH